jgi:hypothetical protein
VRSGDGAASGAAAALIERARALAGAPRPPARAELSALVDSAKAALEKEDSRLRPRDSMGRPGGLLALPALPTILVPDLHARPRFIASVLRWTPPGLARSVASLLESGGANLLCLGDVVHSEYGSAQRRWTAAYHEYVSGWMSKASMDEEMGLSLTAARIVLEAKVAFPAYFHYIKGNHDNISDEEGRGDHSFYKFAAEGEMVASWFAAAYGEALLASYRELELDLPLLALGSRFVASHGEPAFALSRSDIVEYRSRPEVAEALIWTANGEAEPGSVEGVSPPSSVLGRPGEPCGSRATVPWTAATPSAPEGSSCSSTIPPPSGSPCSCPAARPTPKGTSSTCPRERH